MSLIHLPYRTRVSSWASKKFTIAGPASDSVGRSGGLPLAFWTSKQPGNPPVSFFAVRHYTPMTKQEEEAEKQRVAGLSAFAKDQELRQLNRQIAKLEMLRGINTGELYTWRGRYKELSRNYGVPLMMWYGFCWATTGVLVYAAVEVFGVDAISWIAYADTYTGFDLASKIDPSIGKLGLIAVVNEMLEPVRMPLVIITCKPVVDRIAPTKY